MAQTRTVLPGKFVWFELVTKDPQKAQAFYGEVLAWKTKSFPMGQARYDMILTGESLDTIIGGYHVHAATPKSSYWISYVSVENVDATAKATTEHGGKVVTPPFDIPTVGRTARIADPLGAELCVIKNENGDPPDVETVSIGRWVWNELHTHEPVKALAFLERVLGFSHRAEDMGAGGQYHLISRGGVDRGGVTAHVPAGAPPHWLPYVNVDDVDATVARAKRLGANVVMHEDIPGVGRIAGWLDPLGAGLAVIKPLPRQK
jgi:hypothetical protein